MHNEYTMLMSLALDKEATPVEIQRLDTHLRSCQACAEIWQQWRGLDRRLAAAPLLSAPVDLASRVCARLDEAELRVRRARWLSTGLLAWWLSLAGAAALWGGLALTWLQSNPAIAVGWASIVLQWFSALLLLGRGAWATITSLGAPALAGAIGVLACATCVLGVVWLWLIPRRGKLAGAAAMQ